METETNLMDSALTSTDISKLDQQTGGYGFFKRGYTALPREYFEYVSKLDLTHAQHRVLLFLLHFAGSDNNATPSKDTLATRLGMNRDTVSTALKALETKGLIFIKERKRTRELNDTNHYDVRPFWDRLAVLAGTKLSSEAVERAKGKRKETMVAAKRKAVRKAKPKKATRSASAAEDGEQEPVITTPKDASVTPELRAGVVAYLRRIADGLGPDRKHYLTHAMVDAITDRDILRGLRMHPGGTTLEEMVQLAATALWAEFHKAGEARDEKEGR